MFFYLYTAVFSCCLFLSLWRINVFINEVLKSYLRPDTIKTPCFSDRFKLHCLPMLPSHATKVPLVQCFLRRGLRWKKLIVDHSLLVKNFCADYERSTVLRNWRYLDFGHKTYTPVAETSRFRYRSQLHNFTVDSDTSDAHMDLIWRNRRAKET